MKEMLFTGRGGEGLVLASQILADTFARAGFLVQSFPEFKAERRGAPVSAFLRWDEEPIRRRYKVRACDVLVGISPAPPAPEILERVRPGGLVVLNREARFPVAGAFEVARVPASRIARENGILSPEGRPLGNMAVLGACVKLLLPGGLELLVQAVASRTGAAADANVIAARAGYAQCTRQHARAGDTPVAHVPEPELRREAALFPVSTAGSLGNLTGAWALEQPVLSEACSACALCALFCPEGVITRADGTMAIDDRYCKGCGICVAVCPVAGAIRMEEVHA
jgi:2-oxoacid:acceptor oxidoreductase gamma subunit (pyruvate/2-ketoisovalerate family)/2-oxoacid:acceptor oxidoreductase delta subunit (pyruvate/2-ketoisovalerate family)